MTDLIDRIAAVLDLHYGGWIDNGKPDECRCPCGYRPSLGEGHGAHVAAAVVEELGLMPPSPCRQCGLSGCSGARGGHCQYVRNAGERG